jgi:hypothetical protein
MEFIDLSVPAQHDYNDPTVERDPARLQAWLTNLPLMDVVETVRLVLGALEALNDQKLLAEQRYVLLEVYRSTARQLLVTLDPLHIRQLSLSKSQREAVLESVEKLLLTIAGGYKLIIMQSAATAHAGEISELFDQSVCRALEHHCLTLIDNYRFYRKEPDYIFSEIHQLYRLVRHHGLLSLVPPSDEDSPELSIADRYHAIMLLSLTDPSRLAEGEVGLVYDVLCNYAEQCRVTPGVAWTGTADGIFLIDLGSGMPPVPVNAVDRLEQASEPYILDARQSLHAIRKRLSQTPVKVRLQSPEAMVLRRLLPEGSDPRVNRETRHPGSRRVGLLPGLDAIHDFLVAWNRNDPGSGEADVLADCRIVDRSKDGMCLAWKDGGAGDTRVGELMAVLDSDSKALQLILVRSIRVYREGGMEIGVQLIKGSADPVHVNELAQPDEIRRAIIMPATGDNDVADSLLTAAGFYREGMEIRIKVAGREIRARVGRRVFEGPVFDRFEFHSESETISD